MAGLAASGDPRAGAVLSALSEGRLLARPSDKALFIRQGSALTDAKTGAAAPDDPALKPFAPTTASAAASRRRRAN